MLSFLYILNTAIYVQMDESVNPFSDPNVIRSAASKKISRFTTFSIPDINEDSTILANSIQS